MARRADGSMLVDGLLSAGELARRLGLTGLPRRDEDDYQTVGGMAMAALGRVPAEGDGFSWEGWRFEVMDMDGNRVDKVVAAPERSREGSEGDGGPPGDTEGRG